MKDGPSKEVGSDKAGVSMGHTSKVGLTKEVHYCIHFYTRLSLYHMCNRPSIIISYNEPITLNAITTKMILGHMQL